MRASNTRFSLKCNIECSFTSKRRQSVSSRYYSISTTKPNFFSASPAQWNSVAFQRTFFDHLGKKLGITNQDDWYSHLNNRIIRDNGGEYLLNIYNNSAIEALKESYPEHNWIPWKFHATRGYWNSINNHKLFFDWLGTQLGVLELDDWYKVLNSQVVMNHGGSGLLSLYNNSAVKALTACYPDHNWVIWKFNTVPSGYWKSVENQKQFFEHLGTELGVTKLDDWYSKLSIKVVMDHGGARILQKYNQSAIRALMACYPHHNWLPWRFASTMQRFWRSIDNQRRFFDWLGNQLGVQQLDDWYELANQRTITKYGGSSIMALHQGSPYQALKACYPSHNWTQEKFGRRAMRFWDSAENVSQFLSLLSEKLSIENLDDWYRVDYIQLHKFGAARLVNRYGGLYNLLSQYYPHHPWNPLKFLGSRKTQRWLIVSLKKLYPDTEIIEDYIHKSINFAGTNQPLQLDVFIPSLSLAFEFQGKQHYEDVFLFGSSKQYQVRDEEKRKSCAHNGIHLVEVPYWWDRTLDSLQAMIQEQSKKTDL